MMVQMVHWCSDGAAVKIGGVMSVLGSMVQAVGNDVGNDVGAVTKSQTTITKMVRVEVEERAVATVADDPLPPSPAWPTLALYDEAQVIRAKFMDLVTTRTIYSLTTNHLTHFDQAWRSRSISRLRDVYWEVLKRWCDEEGLRSVNACHDKLIKDAQDSGEVLQKVKPAITIVR